MNYLPICLDIRGRAVLVVGGGVAAARKTELLWRAGGQVTVVAPDPGDEVMGLCERGAIRCREDGFAAADLQGVALVVAASGEPATDRYVHEAARAAGILVNVVDRPDLSSFVFPAVIDRSPLVIAVSSGGAAPVLVRQLRARLEALIPQGYARLAALAGRFRTAAHRQIADPIARRRFWEAVFDGPVAADMLAGRDAVAASRLGAMLAQPQAAEPAQGEVYLVDVGPGDPDLLTLRALRLMQQADIVLYDPQVSAEMLAFVRREAERIEAGRWRQLGHPAPGELGSLMVRLARTGRRVLRLINADPDRSIPTDDDLDTLLAHGISVQWVPPLRAAADRAAYADMSRSISMPPVAAESRRAMLS